MPLDIRAINAFQRILDDPGSSPDQLAQVIMSSNLGNMLAQQQQADKEEASQRWQQEFGLKEKADVRAQTTLEANLRQLDEQIAAMQKRLGFEEEQLGIQKEQLGIQKEGNQFNQATQLYNLGLQVPGTGFASTQMSDYIAKLAGGIPLPKGYGADANANAFSGTYSGNYSNVNNLNNLNNVGGTAAPQTLRPTMLGSYSSRTPGVPSYTPGVKKYY